LRGIHQSEIEVKVALDETWYKQLSAKIKLLVGDVSHVHAAVDNDSIINRDITKGILALDSRVPQ
jgi:hypothetical protein